jgi:hypothetical protein
MPNAEIPVPAQKRAVFELVYRMHGDEEIAEESGEDLARAAVMKHDGKLVMARTSHEKNKYYKGTLIYDPEFPKRFHLSEPCEGGTLIRSFFYEDLEALLVSA